LQTQLQLANTEIVRSTASSDVISGAVATSSQGPPCEYFRPRGFPQLGLTFTAASGWASKLDVPQSRREAISAAPRAERFSVTMQQSRAEDRLLLLGGQHASAQGSQGLTSSGQLYRAGPHVVVSTVSVCPSRPVESVQATRFPAERRSDATYVPCNMTEIELSRQAVRRPVYSAAGEYMFRPMAVIGLMPAKKELIFIHRQKAWELLTCPT